MATSLAKKSCLWSSILSNCYRNTLCTGTPRHIPSFNGLLRNRLPLLPSLPLPLIDITL